MLTSEQDALNYIDGNTDILLAELSENEIKTIYTNENTRINVMRDGKRLLKVINRFTGEKRLLDIYKEMVDLKLFEKSDK